MTKKAWRPGTASPAGWSFYSRFIHCPRDWFYYYYLGLKLAIGDQDEALTFGTVYHARHQGVTPVQIMALGEPYSTLLPEADRLYHKRVAYGLPEAVGHEVPYVATSGPLKGIYTCQIDRLEKDGGRELKALARLRPEPMDELAFKTHGEVLGELVASGLPQITVDIITKEKLPQLKTIVVKREMVEDRVREFERQVSEAHERICHVVKLADRLAGDMRQVHAPKSRQLLTLFPQIGLTGHRCTEYNRTCPYFGPCWEDKGLSQFTRDEETQRWRKLLAL